METQQKTDSIFELAAILGRQNEFNEILRIITTKSSFLLDADVVSIIMINPNTQNTVKTIFKDGYATNQELYTIVQTNVIGRMLKDQQPFFSTNLKTDTRFRKNIFLQETIRSVMCVPLFCESILVGCLFALNKKRTFDKTLLSLFKNIAVVSAPFLRNSQKVREYFSAPLPENSLLSKYEAFGLLGKSKRFIELLQAIEAAVRCDVRVLLEGSNGTGKELIAQAIHKLSSRMEAPFITIDCGAIPEHLIESELFGFAKGAFTGATTDRIGLIEEANGGTLFMDEISNLPYQMQAKLLRVLQEGEVRPIGTNKPRKIDVRIIAASSVSLRTQVANRQFREDLFYRLNVYPIYVPILDERKDDVLLLANRFLQKFVGQQEKQAESFDRWLMNFMSQRNWPGNVRELENFVERMVTLAKPEMTVLGRDILPKEFQKEFELLSVKLELHSPNKTLKESLTEYEMRLIQQVLSENEWNQRKAARALKISEGTIRYKIDKLGITKPTK